METTYTNVTSGETQLIAGQKVHALHVVWSEHRLLGTCASAENSIYQRHGEYFDYL